MGNNKQTLHNYLGHDEAEKLIDFVQNVAQENDTNRVFSNHFLQKATNLTLIEKIVLKFKKKLFYRDDLELITIVYKKWRGKTYILNSYNNPPMHPMCRCKITLLR
jgi:hypothetical protein